MTQDSFKGSTCMGRWPRLTPLTGWLKAGAGVGSGWWHRESLSKQKHLPHQLVLSFLCFRLTFLLSPCSFQAAGRNGNFLWFYPLMRRCQSFFIDTIKLWSWWSQVPEIITLLSQHEQGRLSASAVIDTSCQSMRMNVFVFCVQSFAFCFSHEIWKQNWTSLHGEIAITECVTL